MKEGNFSRTLNSVLLVAILGTCWGIFWLEITLWNRKNGRSEKSQEVKDRGWGGGGGGEIDNRTVGWREKKTNREKVWKWWKIIWSHR